MSKNLTVAIFFLLLLNTAGGTVLASVSLQCSALLSDPGVSHGGVNANSSIKGNRSKSIETSLTEVIDSKFSIPEIGASGNLLSMSTKWSDLPPSVRHILESIPFLTAEKRHQFQQKVTASSPPLNGPATFKNLILLGLYDRISWINFVQNLDSRSLEIEGNFVTQYLDYLGQNFPKGLRNEILQIIGSQYYTLKKNYKVEEDVDYEIALGGKRSADLLFKWLLRGDLIIRKEIAAQKTPMEAFSAYISAVRRYISPKNGFEVDDILSILRSAQKGLLAFHEENTEVNSFFTELYVGGSIPNGRGLWATSDLDMSSPDFFTSAQKRKIAMPIIEWVYDRHEDAGFSTRIDKNSWHIWQRIHPIMFRVTATSLEMLVFDPKDRHEDIPRYFVYQIDRDFPDTQVLFH